MDTVSRLSSKFRTTIPRAVRDKLSLAPGDVLVYEIEGDTVRIRKPPPIDRCCLRSLQATLSEWHSPDDAAAYDDL